MPLSEKDKLLMSDKLSGADDETIQAALQELEESEDVPRGSSELQLPVHDLKIGGNDPKTVTEAAPGVGDMLITRPQWLRDYWMTNEMRSRTVDGVETDVNPWTPGAAERFRSLYPPKIQRYFLEFRKQQVQGEANLQKLAEEGKLGRHREHLDKLAPPSQVQEWFGRGYKELDGVEVSDIYEVWLAEKNASALYGTRTMRDTFERTLDSVLRHRHDPVSRESYFQDPRSDTETKKAADAARAQEERERAIKERLEKLMGRK